MDKKKVFIWIIGIMLLVGLSTAVMAERQPAMHAALAHLREAREALKDASADKGGHRVRAIKMINQAIEEVERGIAYDNKH